MFQFTMYTSARRVPNNFRTPTQAIYNYMIKTNNELTSCKSDIVHVTTGYEKSITFHQPVGTHFLVHRDRHRNSTARRRICEDDLAGAETRNRGSPKGGHTSAASAEGTNQPKVSRIADFSALPTSRKDATANK